VEFNAVREYPLRAYPERVRDLATNYMACERAKWRWLYRTQGMRIVRVELRAI